MNDNEEKNIEVSYVPDDTDNTSTDDNVKSELDKKHSKSKTSTLKKLQHKIKSQEKILKRTIEERDDFQDKYLRNLAEVDNFRKRMMKEKEEFQKFILSDFLKELLEVFDNLERALKSKNGVSHEKSIISGVEMIHKQLLELLKKHNVKEIDALNRPFDPNFHQALSKVESKNVKVPTVVEVYQKGFLYNDRLLRPALTKVAIPEESKHHTSHKEGN